MARGRPYTPMENQAKRDWGKPELTSPEGEEITYTLHFGFHTSNNEAEYEALLVGLRLSR